jgi:hypothetical protein
MVLETMWCQKLKDTLSSVATNAEEKRVVETCDWRGKKEPYFPQKWITKTFFLLWSVTR